MIKEYKLKTFIEEISMGPFGSDIKVDNYISEGVPVLNGSNLTSHKLVEDSFNYVSEEKADSLGKANAKRGDIVITHRGTLGQVAYIPQNSKFDRYIISQSQFRVRFNKNLDPVYFSYLMKSDYGQKRLLSFKNHVGVPALAQATTNFKELEVLIHEIADQQKIASILSAIDDKIEFNNKINTELEGMAKLIYDYWFVQFDFPHAFDSAQAPEKPYKSSGGKMVWNKELKREVPEGWISGYLSDLGKIIGGSTPSKDNPEYFTENGIPWITPKDLSNNVGNKFIFKGELDVSEKGKDSASLNVMPRGTILMSSRAPIGYLAISVSDVTTNQGFKSFVPDKPFTTEFVYYKINEMMPVIENNASGSTFKEVSGSTLKGIKIVIPCSKVIEAFTQKVAPIFEKQENLQKQNQALSEMRDWLLPMLMNGQVQVFEEEKKI